MDETLEGQVAKEIGRRVDQWMADNGLTHNALASKLGVSRSTVTNIVNGNGTLTLPMLLKIGLITGIELGDILSPERETRVVLDTNIIVNRLQVLRYIVDLCDHVHIPRETMINSRWPWHQLSNQCGDWVNQGMTWARLTICFII